MIVPPTTPLTLWGTPLGRQFFPSPNLNLKTHFMSFKRYWIFYNYGVEKNFRTISSNRIYHPLSHVQQKSSSDAGLLSSRHVALLWQSVPPRLAQLVALFGWYNSEIEDHCLVCVIIYFNNEMFYAVVYFDWLSHMITC